MEWGWGELVLAPDAWPKVSEDTPCGALLLRSSEVTSDPEGGLAPSGTDGLSHTARDPVSGGLWLILSVFILTDSLLMSFLLMSRFPMGLWLCFEPRPTAGDTDAMPFSYQHLLPRCLNRIFHTYNHGVSED